MEQLGDALHVNMGEAKVTRLDFAGNTSTNYETAEYFRYLGDKAYHQRLLWCRDTLYYKNEQMQSVLYDKGKEALGKGVKCYKIILEHDLYLSRYELRYLKNINRQLNNDVRGSLLGNEEFYRGLVWRWYNGFAEIRKLNKQAFMIEGIKGPKEAKDALFAYLLQQCEQDIVGDFLNALKEGNIFSDRKYYSRLKSMLNELRGTPSGEEVDLIRELDSKLLYIASNAE
jgi:hypothetical protein